MNSKQFRNKKNIILSRLDNIIDKAELQNYNKAVPNITTRNEIRTLIFNFIKEKKRIIYGGTAINFWLCKMDSNKTIYKNIPGDIEFYSPDPLKDTFELCNIFYDKGYKNILGRDAIHTNTYTIFVEHTDFCDISLMSDAIANTNILKEKYNDIYYAKPEFLLADIFRVFSNPLHDYSFRLKKVYDRYMRLRSYYYNPPEKPKQCKVTGIKHTLLEIRQHIYDNYILNNEDIIICGTDAYLCYLEESEYPKKAYEPKNSHEIIIISDNIVNTVTDILTLLDDKEIILKEYTKFFQFHDKKIDIIYKNRVIVSVFGYNNICTQLHKYHIDENNFIQIVGFDYLMMWLNTMLFRTLNKKDKKNHYQCMIHYMFVIQKYYIQKHNLLGIGEDNIFSQFSINCKWLTSSEIYKKKEEIKKKAQSKIKKVLIFEYRPERKKVEKIPTKIYINESGNQIIQRKYLIFKDKKYLPDNIIEKEKKED